MSSGPRLAAGTVIGGDYLIQRPLASGGMGAVYVAEQRSTGKLRALKVMHPELVPDVKSRLRFVEEARVGARIASEHIVDVVGAGVDEATGVPWLAMELLEGESLDAIVSREGGLAPAVVRELFLQMGHALGAAHDRGIVHRDLKPENVFVARAMRTGASLTVKILDFGIAKTIQESKAGVTSTSPIGTPLFMAPEQGTPGAQLRAATDVWALGLIAFHALTGRHYWLAASHGHGVQALFAEVFVHPLVPASRRAAELGAPAPLPPGFDAWFARCVVREPEARFPDARVAIDALLSLLSGGAPAARPSPYAATVPAAATQPLTSAAGTVALPTAQPMSTTDYGARRSSGVGFVAFGLAAAALIGVGAVAGAVVLLGSEDPAPPPVPTGLAPALPPAAPPLAPIAPPQPPAPPVASPQDPLPAPAAAEAPAASEAPAEPDPQPGDPGAPSATGTLTVNSTPWTHVFVGSRSLGTTPLMRAVLPAGVHDVRLVNEAEGISSVRSVRIAAGQETRLVLRLDRAPAEPSTAPSEPRAGNLPQTPSRADIVAAMNGVSGAVSACGRGAFHGLVPVQVTFTGSNGRVSSAVVRADVPPAIGSCVARAVRGARVPPFSQPSFSVNYPFRL